VYHIVAEHHHNHNGCQFGVDAWIGELRSLSAEALIGE
jgi:hypothetical protein